MKEKNKTWQVIFNIVLVVCILQYVFVAFPRLSRTENVGIGYFLGSLIPNIIIVGFFWFIYQNKNAKMKSNSDVSIEGNNMILANKILTETRGGIEILEKTANEGNLESIYNLGTIYFKKQQYEKAFFNFENGAMKGDKDCQYQLGNLYLEGKGVQKDLQKAFEYYESSAIQNNMQSQHNLGLFYLQGLAVGKDRDKAILWFKRASDNGYENSTQVLRDLEKN